MTHHTDAELLRDIEEHMRNMWDARLLPAACWPTELAQRLTQAVRRAPAEPSAWKDHDTAKLVNDLRDCAVQYHAAGQLRERIAHLVSPLAARLAYAPAATVPHGWKLVPTELLERVLDGETVNEMADASDELRAILAAAPQPPEAAPVQLPEPIAKIFFDRKCCEVSELPAWENLRPYGTHELVSVQQVRQLLANHGIQEQST